jgi:hypothetical protein
MDDAKVELDQVAQLVTAWRAERNSKYQHCPKNLLHRARALTASFPIAVITRATGLSEKQVAPYGRKYTEKALETKQEFVELPAVVPLSGPSILIEIRSKLKSISVQLPATTDLGKLFSELLS